MDKLNMGTKNIANENIEKIGQLFPECITEIINEEGKTTKVVDFAVLNSIFNYNVTNYSNPVGGGATLKRVLPVYLAGQIEGACYCESAN